MPKSRGSADWEIGKASDFTKDALFGVAGRVIVITGGGSGIGSMMAAGFVAQARAVGAWCVEVNPSPAGGPFQQVISEGSETALPRVLGEWLDG